MHPFTDKQIRSMSALALIELIRQGSLDFHLVVDILEKESTRDVVLTNFMNILIWIGDEQKEERSKTN